MSRRRSASCSTSTPPNCGPSSSSSRLPRRPWHSPVPPAGRVARGAGIWRHPRTATPSPSPPERADLWTFEARRDETLAALGVAALGLDRPIGEISGGQRSRVALAGLLLAGPDALLLDEPTNHLDDQAVGYLADQLRSWSGPVLFASHDRAFLDEVATELVDLDPSASLTATRYGGGFTDYLAEKARERQRWQQRFAVEQDELNRLEHVTAVTARTVPTGA